jgi:rhamnosyl/mannosyltransferase
LGKLGNQELISHFHACDVFVLPSIANTEAFGIVQLEAMACGKPVISTDLPTGVPFVNQHKKTGLIVPPQNSTELANAIKVLITNEYLAHTYGTAGKQRVQKEFTVQTMVKQVLALYEEVLSKQPGDI